MASSDTFLQATNVSQTFDSPAGEVPVLHDISVAIPRGSFNVIFGPSGSGKSTFLNVLTGLLPPTSGSIMFEGRDLYGLSDDEVAGFRAQLLGIVYQTSYWVKSLTVIENVALSLYFLGHDRDTALARAKESLHRVGMERFSDQMVTQMSGGEQQRVSMARALVTDPTLIVADEPTGNLDTKNGDMIMSLLEQCQKEDGQTVILVTHDLKYLPLADNLFHIQDGTLSVIENKGADGSRQELLDQVLSDIDLGDQSSASSKSSKSKKKGSS